MEHQSYTKEDLKKSLIVAGTLTGLMLFLYVIMGIVTRLGGTGFPGILFVFLACLQWLLPILTILSWSEYIKRYVYLEMWPEDGQESGKSWWRLYANIGIKVLVGLISFFVIWYVVLFVTALLGLW